MTLAYGQCATNRRIDDTNAQVSDIRAEMRAEHAEMRAEIRTVHEALAEIRKSVAVLMDRALRQSGPAGSLRRRTAWTRPRGQARRGRNATMTYPVDGADAGPVGRTARIDAIDVLRGAAPLGILVMNVQAFAMPQAAYFNPTAYGDHTGANLYVWVAGQMFADQKFMTIFSMLFGAGIVLMAGRAEAPGDARRVHYRRMAWLLVIGLLHAHLLWAGDILFLYAVCGMLVHPLRRQLPGRLLAIGAVLLAVASAYSIGSGLSLPYWPEQARAAFTTDVWRPTPAMIDAEPAVYRGGWLGQQPARSAAALLFEKFVLVTWGVWRAGGLMLIGMALFKLDVFSARRSPRFYATLIGLPTVSLSIWTFRSLGRNITNTVVTRREHALITSGPPYRYVRHPFYVTTALAFAANSLTTAN